MWKNINNVFFKRENQYAVENNYSIKISIKIYTLTDSLIDQIFWLINFL